MNLKELQKERLRFMEVCESNPKMQGTRNDILKNEKYDRGRVIMSHFTNHWPHYGKYIADQIDKIYDCMKNDTPELFFTKMLFTHRWRPIILINFIKEGHYEIDKQNDDIIISEVYEKGHKSPSEVRKMIIKHYQKDPTVLYFLKYRLVHRDLLESPIVRVGITKNLHQRVKTLNTASPYEIYTYKSWRVSGIELDLLERMIHKHFFSINVKLEWFSNSDGKLLDKVLDYVKTIKGVRLSEC